MSRTLGLVVAATVLALGAAVPALAQSQLIADAGLTKAEAEGLTLNQIVAAKYNRDRSFDDRQAVVIVPGLADRAQLAASVGVASNTSLNEIVAVKDNRNKSPADRQLVILASRSVPSNAGARSQLISSAGLTAAEAEGLTLNQIVAAKYNHEGISYSDRQRVSN